MENVGSVAGVFKRLAFFAVLGFLVVILMGPVIAIFSAFFAVALSLVSIFLPFALIGFAVWVPYTILQGRPVPWRQMYETTAGVIRFLVVWPIQMGGRVWNAGVNFTKSAADKAYHYGSIVLEMIAGALLGGLVVAVVRWDQADSIEEIGLGALIGAVVGMVIGISNRRAVAVSNRTSAN